MLADFQGLSLLDTTTSEWRPLTRQRLIHHPFWSEDGAWVYFNDGGDTGGVWRVHVPEGRVEEMGPIPLPSGYSACWAVDVTPDENAVLSCWDSRLDIIALDYKEQK
jgi:hypothetical protein